MDTTTRRRIRTAPKERPKVDVSDSLKAQVKEIADIVSAKIIEVFASGGLPGTAEEFQLLERKLLEIAHREMVGPVLGAVLVEIHEDEDFVRWAMADCRSRVPMTSRSDALVNVYVAGGHTVTVETPYMAPDYRDDAQQSKKQGQRGKGGAGLYPVLAHLGVLCRVSPHIASTVARSCAQVNSYEEAVETLAAQGIDLDVNVVRNIVGRVGDAGIVAREQASNGDTQTLAGKRVVACIDGGRVRYRIDKKGRKKKNGRRGYKTPWREPKVVAIYTVDEEGHKTHEDPIYEGTLAPWEDASELIARTLSQYGAAEAASLTLAADGSDTIWGKVEEILETIGIERSKVFLFVDFYHAVEHLYEAVKLVSNWTDKQREGWVRKQARRLKKGQVQRVIVALEKLPADDGKALDKEINYFRKRIDRMRYDELRKRGLPIGTGAVESAIRRIVNLRLKGNGIFWKPENAERMLYLRCRHKSRRWSEVEEAIYKAALVPAQHIKPNIFARLTE